MPVGTCHTHGWINSFCHVCSHISEDVSAARIVRHFNTYFISMEGVPDIPFFTIINFCDDFVKERALPLPGVIPEQKWDYEDERKWKTDLICKVCLKQYSQQEVSEDRSAV
jgi:hypothetical protein